MKRTQTIVKIYRQVALLLLNVVVIAMCFNLVLWVAFAVKDGLGGAQNAVDDTYGRPDLTSVYPDLSRQEIEELLGETWPRQVIYEPFTQFREAPRQGKYVNVGLQGFRQSENQGPWPPANDCYNIFLFGGSTTFGYGVPDDQTIASHLQNFLSKQWKSRKVRVYNFGRGFYYSSQERILFENLLRTGFKPDLAVFLDGLNDFYLGEDRPAMTARLEEIVNARNEERTPVHALKEFLQTNNLPMTRLARGLRSKIFRMVGSPDRPDANVRSGNDETVWVDIIDRYIGNKNLIDLVADGCGVKTAFLWQPVPMYGYDLEYHVLSEYGLTYPRDSRLGLVGCGYAYMAEHLDRLGLGENFLWLADMQKDKRMSLYVDTVHYSGFMCDVIGREIGKWLLDRD